MAYYQIVQVFQNRDPVRAEGMTREHVQFGTKTIAPHSGSIWEMKLVRTRRPMHHGAGEIR
ncbi:MAG: hypothetical protein FJ276_31330 [Planctomycetes bacterium]|nr:hypothetical protein [Planctomycetota bacterium]